MTGLLVAIGFMFGFIVWQIVFRFVVAGSQDPKRDETRIFRRFALTASGWILALGVASYAAHSTHRDGSVVLAGIAAAPAFSIAGVAYWMLKRRRIVSEKLVDLQVILDERLAALRSRPVADLVSLPVDSSNTIRHGTKEMRVNVYRELTDGGAHRIVVQVIRERWFGITARVLARGFEISLDGRVRDLEEPELYDYT